MPTSAPDRKRGFPDAAGIERKAQQIDDPIERLKFLREATSSPSSPKRLHWGPLASICLVAFLLCMRSDAHLRRQADVRRIPNSIRYTPQAMPDVWRVEDTKDFEVYSNGLRIENQLTVSNVPRSYALLGIEGDGGPPKVTLDPSPNSRNKKKRPAAAAAPVPVARPAVLIRTQPAGIVFHTTESHQVPFEADQQRNLKRISQDTLLFVRNRRAYHFVIDRFGRVHRIVAESDAANHAGNSIWADSKWLYLELNQSFLGIAFEASMQADQAPVNEAQMHAGKVLTDMLRSKYNIPSENCVTHAQISVNPDNMLIGWHCDWGKGFPFREVGLPDNYQLPPPALYLMGFDYDPFYVNATNPGIWNGLALAEERFRHAAWSRGVTEAVYRSQLQKRYREEMTALRHRRADEEN